jgi:hypothetical protein
MPANDSFSDALNEATVSDTPFRYATLPSLFPPSLLRNVREFILSLDFTKRVFLIF